MTQSKRTSTLTDSIVSQLWGGNLATIKPQSWEITIHSDEVDLIALEPIPSELFYSALSRLTITEWEIYEDAVVKVSNLTFPDFPTSSPWRVKYYVIWTILNNVPIPLMVGEMNVPISPGYILLASEQKLKINTLEIRN